VPIPIACNLTESDARDQLGEWRALLAASAAEPEHVSPTELSFRLRDDLPQLAELVRLAQREQACCPFFEFTIRIEANQVRFSISVPAEAAGVLEVFAA
jgi:hypothetical protein